MLDRKMGVATLYFVLSLLAPTFAFSAVLTPKLEAAKSADHDGYQPRIAMKGQAFSSEIEPNDAPANANPVGVAEAILGGFGVAGDVDFFAVTASSAGYLAISTGPSDTGPTDTVISVFSADGITLLSFNDDGGMGLFSAIEHFFAQAGVTYFVKVEHFSALAGDGYVLSIEPGTPPPASPANDQVADAAEAMCNSLSVGSTVGAADDAEASGCVGFDPRGGDVFYRVTLPYSYQLNLQVTPTSSFDPALYIFTDPKNPAGSCLVGSDAAFTDEGETLVYVNEDFESGVELFVGVDSWDPASYGDFILSVSCDFVVEAEISTWSGLKANFE